MKLSQVISTEQPYIHLRIFTKASKSHSIEIWFSRDSLQKLEKVRIFQFFFPILTLNISQIYLKLQLSIPWKYEDSSISLKRVRNQSKKKPLFWFLIIFSGNKRKRVKNKIKRRHLPSPMGLDFKSWTSENWRQMAGCDFGGWDEKLLISSNAVFLNLIGIWVCDCDDDEVIVCAWSHELTTGFRYCNACCCCFIFISKWEINALISKLVISIVKRFFYIVYSKCCLTILYDTT